VLGDGSEDASPDGAEESPPLPDLQQLITRAVNSTSQDDGWAHLGAVGTYLSSAVTSFDPRNYGYPKLIALAEAQPFLEVENEGGGSARVRLKPRRRTRKSPAKKTTTQPAKKTAEKAG
jgi:hypothetical protein